MPTPRRALPLLLLAACQPDTGTESSDATSTSTTSPAASSEADTTDTTSGSATATVEPTSDAPTTTSASDPADSDTTTAATGETTGGTTGDEPGAEHDTALGCAGVYNPDQLLDLHLTMDPADWTKIRGDLTFSIYAEAQFHCGDEAPITVGVRRKRSGGTQKVGLKIDFNELVMGQRWQDLRKLSLENGVSSGDPADDADVGSLVAEYLGWRIMQRGGVIASRSAFIDLHVNDELIGTYVNVEQVDTRFLKHRYGDNDGWLYKHSGGDGDGPQTHEDDGMADPYADYFCFWQKGGQACDPPADAALLAELPTRLDIPQMLRMGAVNAYIANTDSPLFKDNNYYYYDWAGGGRSYMPTDLDTTMNMSTHVLEPDGHFYDTVLFTHWKPDYVAILTELVEQQAPASVVQDELARVLAVAGASLDADPWATGTAEGAVLSLGDWWQARDLDVRAQLGL